MTQSWLPGYESGSKTDRRLKGGFILIRQYRRANLQGKPLFQAVSRQIIHKWWEELNLIYATYVSIDGDGFFMITMMSQWFKSMLNFGSGHKRLQLLKDNSPRLNFIPLIVSFVYFLFVSCLKKGLPCNLHIVCIVWLNKHTLNMLYVVVWHRVTVMLTVYNNRVTVMLTGVQ